MIPLDDHASENAEPHDSEKWLKAIDRGGLISIDDCMFGFLVAIEIELRNHLTTSYSAEQNLKSVIPKIIGNEDVLYYWDIISINWNTAEAKELLNLIIEHYTIVRGFSFAKAFNMEKYKQSMKKTTQKSKGLRKKLDTGSTCTSSKVYNDE